MNMTALRDAIRRTNDYYIDNDHDSLSMFVSFEDHEDLRALVAEHSPHLLDPDPKGGRATRLVAEGTVEYLNEFVIYATDWPAATVLEHIASVMLEHPEWVSAADPDAGSYAIAKQAVAEFGAYPFLTEHAITDPTALKLAQLLTDTCKHEDRYAMDSYSGDLGLLAEQAIANAHLIQDARSMSEGDLDTTVRRTAKATRTAEGGPRQVSFHNQAW